MDDNLQRLKIEMLRKSSADIAGRGSMGPTSTPSDSSSGSKKGSTSRGSTNGGRQISTDAGRAARSKSLITTKSSLSSSGSFSSLSPAAAAAAAMPSSGSNSLSGKRGSLPLSLKPRPPSPGSRKPPSVPSSSPSPVADAKPDQQVSRRNSASKRL